LSGVTGHEPTGAADDEVLHSEAAIRIEAAIDLGTHVVNGELDPGVGMRSVLAHLHAARRQLTQGRQR
jgi:hypothetical protein